MKIDHPPRRRRTVTNNNSNLLEERTNCKKQKLKVVKFQKKIYKNKVSKVKYKKTVRYTRVYRRSDKEYWYDMIEKAKMRKYAEEENSDRRGTKKKRGIEKKEKNKE